MNERHFRLSRHGAALLCILALPALAGCEQARSAMGMTKQSPDEFAVVSRPPLSIPPEYRLRVPEPGATGPKGVSTREAAREILTGRPRQSSRATQQAIDKAVSSGRMSRGEAAILAKAHALETDPSIRQTVNAESSALVEADHSMFDKVVFWRKPPPPGTVVDAEKEARRLREAAALGKKPDEGKVPVIERHERGLLEGLF